MKPSFRSTLPDRAPVKFGRDLLSIAKILSLRTLTRRQKLNCLNFYFTANGVRNLLVSPGRSGAAWIMLGIELALDLANGGTGSYHYDNGLWKPEGKKYFARLDWRIPCESALPWVANPQIYHSQFPYRDIRCGRLAQMKTVVIARSILEILESTFFKVAGPPFNLDINETGPYAFNWDETLTRLIRYYNSWGEVAKSHDHILILNYEELKTTTAAAHKKMTDFWGYNIPRTHLETAFNSITRSEMKKKFSKTQDDISRRVSFRKERGVIPEPIFSRLIDRIQNELIHDFGYRYDHSHEYGKLYD